MSALPSGSFCSLHGAHRSAAAHRGDGDARAPRMVAGRYRLREVLGQGGNGQVWVADDVVLGEEVALKLLTRADAASLARARREIAALRLLRLPGVVRLLDEGVDGETPFLVMERLRGVPFPGARAGQSTRAGPHASPASPAGAASPGAGPVDALASTALQEHTASMSGEAGHAVAVSRMAPWPWPTLAERAEALFEILARVHAAGIMHRDLKPANILVGAEGRPTVLDFGLSWGTPLGEHLTEAGTLLGTPAYLAPEQVRGADVDVRTDLYAVGVMLYEALTGRLPHHAHDLQALLYARVARPPLPLADLAPEVPAPIAALVGDLLATAPQSRPGSAAAVLAVLRGQADACARSPMRLPWLGDDAPIRAVVQAARAGRSIDIIGPAGAGRSRCLHEAAARLAAAGCRVLWTRASHRPFASLQAVIGTLDGLAGASLARARAVVEDRLRQARDAVILVDDAGGLDRWSHEVLCRHAAGQAGAVIRVLPADEDDSDDDDPNADEDAHEDVAPGHAVRMAPLRPADLRALFVGPDRLFHLAEDAARLLWQRTEGLPARVVEEMHGWLRAGLLQQDGARWAMAREVIDRLGSGLPEMPLLPHTALAAPGAWEDAPHLDALLGWLALAGGCDGRRAGGALDMGALAVLAGEPLWRVEAELDELVRRGAARRLASGRIEPLGHTSRPPGQQQQAHLALGRVLRPGHAQRLFHLLAGGAPAPAIAAEAMVLARREAARGRLGAAAAALYEALLAVRGRAATGGRHELRLLSAAVVVALHQGTPRALDRVLYELCRGQAGETQAAQLERLVRAALAVHGVSAERAAALARELPRFEDPALERWRHWVRVRAAVRTGGEQLEAAVAALGAWAEAAGARDARAVHAWATGMLRYSQGRFDEAARAYAETMRHETWATARISAMINRASALMEAFAQDEAARMATRARRLAARCRHAHFEARAEWIVRAADYRRGRLATPDLSLVDVVGRIGEPNLEALVCFNEAAVLFRAGAGAEAAALAERAAGIWKRMGREWPELLARCLAFAARGEVLPAAGTSAEDTAAALAERARACPVPGIGVQILGLLGRACPGARPRWQHAVEPLCALVDPRFRHARMDALSADEACAWAGMGA